MKTKVILLSIIAAILLTSCKTSYYYQVYQATPSAGVTNNDNKLIYEDENCIVTYNLWDNGGNIGFNFYNKTNQNLYVNMEESFFILNGVAYDYFHSRVRSNSESFGTASSHSKSKTKLVTGSTRNSTSFSEKNIVCIPSKASKNINEYNVNNRFYRDSELIKYPKSGAVNSKSYSKDDSPFVFSNRISYSVGQSDKLIRFENEFYVSEISNQTQKDMSVPKSEISADAKGASKKQFLKDAAPSKFYLKYAKSK